jgi:hypothetical protein
MAGEITPFRIDVPETDLADLRERLQRTRWPEAETVTDWSQGVPRLPAGPVPLLGHRLRLAGHGGSAERAPAVPYRPTKGGHFAAFEQPESFVSEVRSFFRLVR